MGRFGSDSWPGHFGEELWGLKHSWGQLNRLWGLSRRWFEDVGVARGVPEVPTLSATRSTGPRGVTSIFSW